MICWKGDTAFLFVCVLGRFVTVSFLFTCINSVSVGIQALPYFLSYVLLVFCLAFLFPPFFFFFFFPTPPPPPPPIWFCFFLYFVCVCVCACVIDWFYCLFIFCCCWFCVRVVGSFAFVFFVVFLQGLGSTICFLWLIKLVKIKLKFLPSMMYTFFRNDCGFKVAS